MLATTTLHSTSPRIGYVVKRYPRFSETFILNEILAHEQAGLEIVIFALGFPAETHFQELIAQVKAPVRYLLADPLKAADFWNTLGEASRELPGIWPALSTFQGEDVQSVYQAVRLAVEVQRTGITHLHAHFATSATTVARLAGRLSGVSYTFTAHAKDIFHESVDEENLRSKIKDAAAVVTVSEYNRTYLQERFGADAAGVRRVYNGLDLSRFPYSSPVERSPVIAGVGRLVEKKGFVDLVEACAILRDRGVPFECQIVGSGELEQRLRTVIQEKCLDREVVLLGPKPQPEVIQLLQRSAVLAAPCVVGEDQNRDGLPTVLLEAMALGTPCVSTDVTGIPEVLKPGETGIMVPQRDPSALADALERLLRDPTLRLSLSQRARRLMEAEFNIHHNAACIRALFSGAARQRGDNLGRVAS